MLVGVGQLLPDLHPLTVLGVDALTTDGDLDLIDDRVTDRVDPVDVVGSAGDISLNGREGEDKVTTRDQIGITLNARGKTATKRGLILERLFHAFDGKVGVATVNNFEERDLGGVCQVDILHALAGNLGKTSSGHFSLLSL